MILENNTDTKTAVRNMQRKLRSRMYVNETLDPQLRPHFPLTKVLEDPLFGEKSWSNLLLIGDACSFVLCRWYRGRADVDMGFRSSRTCQACNTYATRTRKPHCRNGLT